MIVRHTPTLRAFGLAAVAAFAVVSAGWLMPAAPAMAAQAQTPKDDDKKKEEKGEDKEQAKQKDKPKKANPAKQQGAKSKQPAPTKQKAAPKKQDQPEEEKPKVDPDLRKKIDNIIQGKASQRAEDAKKRAGRQPARPARDPAKRVNRPPPAAKNPQPNPLDAAKQSSRPGGATGDKASGPVTKLDIPSGASDIPPEERTYVFSIKDGTYEQLLDAFARMTDLAVIGDVPKDGRVTFVSAEELTFKEAFGRVRMLLFRYKPHEPYWMVRRETHMEVIRVNDFYRILPRERMYRSVEEYRAANLPDDELALVIYTPKSGSISDLKPVRDFLPDYVRVAPLSATSVTIFALVKDINKYLELIKLFPGGEVDPRPIEVVKVEYVSPSTALERLRQLMDLDGGAKRRLPRTGRPSKDVSPIDTMPEPEVTIVPDDGQGVLIVRAMQDKIDEIKSLLPYVDVDTSIQGLEPIVIPVQHADPEQLVGTIQQILAAFDAPAEGATPQKRPGQRAKTPTPRPSSRTLRADGVTLMVHPSESAIIVIAVEEDAEQVRELVKKFDVATRPVRIVLEHADAAEVATAIRTVLGGGPVKSKAGLGRFELVEEPSGKALWFTGRESDLARVRDIVAELDSPGQLTSLRIVNLRFQTPSFVADMLQQFDQESVSAAPTPRPKAVRRPATIAAAKFTPHDEQGRLFILCTDYDWERYQPIIDQLEKQAEELKPFERILVEHVDPSEAIERLTAMISGSSPAASASLVAVDEGIMVMNPTPAIVEEIRTLLVEIDQPSQLIRRMFEIRHRDTAEIIAAVETLISGGAGDKTPQRRTKPPDPKGANVSVGMAQSDLTIVQLGSNLVVHATPKKMAEVAELIAEFDVPDAPTEMRVYEDFPPRTDVSGVSEALQAVFTTRGATTRKGRSIAPTEGPKFIPQPAFGKLIVIAETAMFEEIETLLERIKGTDQVLPIDIQFVAVAHVDAEVLVEMVTPLLDLQINELLATGQLAFGAEPATAPAKPVARRTATAPEPSAYYHLVPDSVNDRVVAAAPQIVMERIRDLITKFDTPYEAGEVVFRTVELAQADAAEMVKAIKEMMGQSARRTPPRPTTKGVAAQVALTPQELVVTEAPGGGVVVLHGMLDEVNQAEEWIKTLDAMSERDSEIKVYALEHADIKMLVEMIMAVVDKPTTTRPTPGKAARIRRPTEPIEEEDEFELTKTWTGQDIYVQADLVASTMVVAASESKIKQIDKIVAQFDIPPEEDLTNVFTGSAKTVPSFMYELKYVDPFDAEFQLQALLDQLWIPPDEVPKVESALFGDFLIIKYPHEDRFAEVEDFIREYVDKPNEEATMVRRIPIAVPASMKPSQLAEWLKGHLGEDVEVVDVSATSKRNVDIERVGPRKPGNPCVLPQAVTAIVDAALATAVAQDPPSDPPAEQKPQDTQEEIPPDDEVLPDDVLDDLPPLDDLDADPSIDAAVESIMAQEMPVQSTDGADTTKAPKIKSVATAGQKLKIYVDDETGNVVVEGPGGVLDEIPELLEGLEEELKKTRMPPDIRVFRLRYINVHEAAEIIEEMFNATRQQRQAVQAMARRQQQLQAQRARQQQRQQQQQQQQAQQPGQRAGRQPTPQQQQQQQQQQAAAGQLPEPAVRIYPNPRDRTLILRAETNQYPALLDLIATIDQPKPIDSKLRIFKLEKLNAGEVVDMLKDMLDLEKRTTTAAAATSSGRRPTPGAATRSRSTAGGALPQTIMQETVAGTNRLGVDPQDIKLSSNEASNTILVMAPEAAIEFVGNLIKQLESEEIPQRETKHYELKHADAGDVADYLAVQFDAKAAASSGRRGGVDVKGGPAAPTSGVRSLNTPSFIPYPRLNLLTVLATTEQFEKIDELVGRIDVGSDEWSDVTLKHADAKMVADTLTQMFGSSGTPTRSKTTTGGAATAARFIGEDGGRILLYSAPPGLKEPILAAVQKLEADAQDVTSIRIITLKHASASKVADAIESAYGGVGRGARGAPRPTKVRFTVTAHDPTRQLFVQADDDTFAKIQSLAETVDKPGEFLGELRIYPLQYADAKEVHATMTTLVKDYMARLPAESRAAEPFSAEVNEKANALAVLGSPTVFAFIEKNLAMIDSPANAASPTSVMLVALKTADAQEVAGNINRLWVERSAGAGTERAQAEANRSLNMLIVRGPQDQLDEIKEQFIDPLQDQAAPALLTETIDLQFADAEAVAQTINDIFESRRRAVQGLGPRGSTVSPMEFTVVVTPQPSTRQVVVQASAQTLPQIKDWIAQLDREDVAAKLAPSVRIYSLKFADPEAVVRIINDWGRTRGGGRGESHDTVVASSEPITQSLVITASHANHVIIQSMIDGLEGAEVSRQEVHVLSLENADAESVSRTLAEIFVRSAPRSGGVPPISVSAVQGSKAVLVKCKDEIFSEIQAVVAELDKQEAVLGETVSVVSLLYADAAEVEAALRGYLQMPGSGGRGELVGDTRLSVLSQSNALVISGDKESVTRMESLVNQLDLSGEKGSVPQIIKLEHASAGQLAPMLEEMFAAQGGGKRGQPPPIIKANDPIGLIVRASQTDMAAIEAIIEQLDSPEVALQPNFRIVQVGMGLNVNDVATKIEEAVNEGARAQPGAKRGGDIPSIRITPDTRTQSLIVSGSRELLDQAEQMAKQLEALGPPGGKNVKILTLNNAAAEDVQRAIDLLKGELSSSGSRSRGTSTRRPRSGRGP